MLRDSYQPSPHFWEIVQHLSIEMEPELAKIDQLLDDEQLFQQIKHDLSKRYPMTLQTGRFNAGGGYPPDAGGQTLVSVHLSADRVARQGQSGVPLVLPRLL